MHDYLTLQIRSRWLATVLHHGSSCASQNELETISPVVSDSKRTTRLCFLRLMKILLVLLAAVTSAVCYEHKFGGHNANNDLQEAAASDGVSITPVLYHGKRQVEFVQVKRQARIKYSCPFSGTSWKTFKWSVSYDFPHEQLDIEGLTGIGIWDHMETEANDFSTRFHTIVYDSIGHFCCEYHYSAQVIGSLYLHPRSITSELWDSHDPEIKIKITEQCVTSSQGRVCPAPETAARSVCDVIRVSQGRA